MTERQIIETLATKVMGWKRYGDTNFWHGDNGNLFDSSLWNPLKNIADAWMIVDKLVLERGLPVAVQSSVREYRASFNGEEWTYGNTAQEAISRAALLMF